MRLTLKQSPRLYNGADTRDIRFTADTIRSRYPTTHVLAIGEPLLAVVTHTLDIVANWLQDSVLAATFL